MTKNIPPTKQKGRTLYLTSRQDDELESFICPSFNNRRMTFLKISTGPFKELANSENVIRNAQRRRGCSRKLALVKPPTSERNKIIIRKSVEGHFSLTKEHWQIILWTDESRVTDRWHTWTWVMRKSSLMASPSENGNFANLRIGRERNWMRPVLSENIGQRRGGYFAGSLK